MLANEWLGEMGSHEIWNLEYRQGFAFIGTYGKLEEISPNEARA